MTTRADQTKFVVGGLYNINGNMYVCSKLSRYYWETRFRSFPTMRGSSYKLLAAHIDTEVQLLTTNVPFSRKSKKGRERVDKWVADHPEYLI